MRAEDERRWSPVLAAYLKDPDPGTRQRAAMAAGRIGTPETVEPLAGLLQREADERVRAAAAFALGETEQPGAIDPLVAALRREGQTAPVRARIVEALGKVVGAMPKADEAKAKSTAQIILTALADEGAKGEAADDLVVLKGITAVLRAKPENAGPVLVPFLSSTNARIRADTENTLTRLKLADGNEKMRVLLTTDPDPIVRANAARVLGATTDKAALDQLADRIANDKDQRVRISAIRALGALKDERAEKPLMSHGAKISMMIWEQSEGQGTAISKEESEFLEIANALANIKAGKDWPAWAVAARKNFISKGRFSPNPELEIMLAKVSPAYYVDEDLIPADLSSSSSRIFSDWHITSSVAQGLGAIAALEGEGYGARLPLRKTQAVAILRTILDDARLSANALPDVLTAYAAFKPEDGSARLRAALKHRDFVVRSTAASGLGDIGPSAENERALIASLAEELRVTESNDGALAVLDALAKQKTDSANVAMKTALDSPDSLVRHRAVTLLKENGAGDLSSKLGTATTRFTDADYARALDRTYPVFATVTTTKGTFVIALFPPAAPMTVDNFVRLAERKYFDGQVFHRVVPNFVIQTGDPRGDGNGGPGYAIRCEINVEEYARGAVGMALSGKDTGGSQWFVTHSPQPHLDGGYTVFGQVAEKDMRVVDAIARGDRILTIRITGSGNGVGSKGSQ